MGVSIRSVVIVGGGSAGWMTAAALARVFSPALSITLVESEEIGIVGVGEATIPPIARFNQMLGLDEDAFIRETRATFKLGIEFRNWGERGGRYMHSFGEVGQDLAYIPFHHYYYLARAEGDVCGTLWDYDANTCAAFAGRFARPAADHAAIMYAFHFDAALYAAFLRRYAEGRGVTRREGTIVDVALHGETGDVRSVKLADGGVIEGDFFVDCSGFRGLVIGEALKTPYEDWRHWLACDRALAVPSARVEAPTPYTRSTAEEAGWRWRIPLQHRTGNGIVYPSSHLDDTRAQELLMAGLDGAALAEPRRLRFTTGRRRSFWVKNCLAIGLSGGFLEPLESTSIHLIQSAIERLIILFPRMGDNERLRREFNESAIAEMEFIRDFVILHYHLNQRAGEPFWDYCRHMSVPDSLTHRIELFRDAGAIHAPPFDIFRLPSWLEVMAGQGLRPRSVHPFAHAVTRADRSRFLAQLREGVTTAVARLPTHESTINRIVSGGR